MASEDEQTTEQATEQTTEQSTEQASAPDYSWAPESFVKDGALDTEGFRAKYDELAAFKAQEDERLASLPTDPAQYELRVPELNLPDGVELPKDANGNPIPFHLDEDDPELPALRQLAMDLKLDQGGLDKILHLYAVREARAAHERNKVATEERSKLGPEADSRISEMKRQIGARLPKEMAEAIMDGISSADALRGLERLLSTGTRSTTTPPARQDFGTMSPIDLLDMASRQKQQKSA